MARTSPEAGLALDEEAFERFHAATSAGLWGYLRRLGGDAALADDVVQESYVKFLGHLNPGSGERERRAFLYRIATNLLRDRWRQKRRETLGIAGLRSDLVAGGGGPAAFREGGRAGGPAGRLG